MERKNGNSGNGVGFFGLLTLLFIGLKLTKVITWSWVWVLSPIWLPLAVLLAGLVVYIVYHIIKNKMLRNRSGE